MILVIDNYDSFVFNLARYFRVAGMETEIFRNDTLLLDESLVQEAKAIVLSPGPGAPKDAGICVDLIRSNPHKPIFGVCLGHQCIAEAYGGFTVKSKEPMHGRASLIEHNGIGLFQNISNPMHVGRYHSLSIGLPESGDLVSEAKASDGEIMAIKHVVNPHYGVQFHPESLLTQQGDVLIANFLKEAGVA